MYTKYTFHACTLNGIYHTTSLGYCEDSARRCLSSAKNSASNIHTDLLSLSLIVTQCSFQSFMLILSKPRHFVPVVFEGKQMWLLLRLIWNISRKEEKETFLLKHFMLNLLKALICLKEKKHTSICFIKALLFSKLISFNFLFWNSPFLRSINVNFVHQF